MAAQARIKVRQSSEGRKNVCQVNFEMKLFHYVGTINLCSVDTWGAAL